VRTSQKVIDTEALPWERLSDLMQCKLLNGRPEEGAHTMLLYSAPRDPDIDFAQYHPIDEEFLCLEGDFTFDGSTWFGPGSYAFYPAYFVHGTAVHVRGGYLLYLRQSGPSELLKVDEPKSHTPYYVGEGEPGGTPLQVVDVLDGEVNSSVISTTQYRELHRDPQTGAGSTLLTVSELSPGQALEVSSEGLLEVFVLSGCFALSGGEVLGPRAYHCEVADRPRLMLRCTEPGSLIISHDSNLQLEGVAGAR
jgi:hypothetical protein